jgi:predicted DCC family thiol-disulfide oxidoreductase YuxK
MQAESLSSRYILAYDADCGPCTRFRHAVDIFDIYQKIDFISLTEADQKGLLDKISVSMRYKSFHLIFPDREEIKSGSDALIKLIEILPGSTIISPIINYFPGAKQIVHFIYTKFSKLHDGASCSINKNNNTNDNNNINRSRND